MIRLLPLLVLFLSACSGGAGLNLGNYPDPTASKDEFIYCYGYGCTKKITLGLNKYEWKSIQKIFKKKSKNAQVERAKISKAIALIEKYTGKLAGTENDLPKAPIQRKTYFELDCIDETINTTKYLKFLVSAKLLKFYIVGRPAYKGGFINGVYPHNSATVAEIETGDVYVIDSYIYKNGMEPDVRSLKSWQKYRIEDLEKAEQLNRL